jgi:DNA polymerase V
MNKKLGADKIKLSINGYSTNLKMNQKNLSPRYTTDIKQIIKVKA